MSYERFILSIAPPQNPKTPAEWQNAVDVAKALRLLHDARLYGLVVGGPEVDAERCDQLLEQGCQLGITPRPDTVERFVAELNGEWVRP